MKAFLQHITKGLCAIAFLLFAHTGVAYSDAIISFGDTILGVNDEGHLNVFPGRDGAGLNPDTAGGSRPVGLWRLGLGDATAPGCLCEGWGVAVTTSSGSREAGFANEALGSGGLTGGTFGATSTTATSSIGLSGAPVQVTHVYGPSLAADVFQGQVTIRNTSTTDTMEDVVYRRAMDWDVPPTEFREYVTHGGVEANLESVGGNVRFASDNGFANSDPRIAAGALDSSTINVDFEDNGVADHGSVFDFAFGDIAPGESRIFNIFYGSAATEFEAKTAIDVLGADVYSLGQSSTPGGPTVGTPATFLFAFGGVGGIEPGSDPSVPVLPFVPAPGMFEFPEPTPRRWFDPPFVDGFTYTLDGGATFTEVMAPPASFGFGELTILDDAGSTIGTLVAGGSFDLTPYGLTTFSLVGIDPLLDEADPDFLKAFPTFLDWTGTASTLHMDSITSTGPGTAPVPEPGTIILLGTGLAGIAFYNRHRSRIK